MNLIIIATRLLVFILFINIATAQSVPQLSTETDNRKELINFYQSFRSESSPIFNGCEYERYPFYINKGIPFFLSDTMTLGSVVYNGMLYKDVEIMYDMILDELIARDITGKNLIRLVKQKVDSFYLYGEKFILIKDGDKIMPYGYYQVMREGENELLKKEIKYIKDKVKFGEDLEKNIESKITYYEKQDGKYIVSNSPSNK